MGIRDHRAVGIDDESRSDSAGFVFRHQQYAVAPLVSVRISKVLNALHPDPHHRARRLVDGRLDLLRGEGLAGPNEAPGEAAGIQDGKGRAVFHAESATRLVRRTADGAVNRRSRSRGDGGSGLLGDARGQSPPDQHHRHQGSAQPGDKT